MSDIARRNVTLIFATYLANAEYHGPVLRLRRPNDDEEQNFYATADGSLSTSDLGTVSKDGQTYLQYMGGSDISYVVNWYDQSGSSNDAFQAESSLQPLFSYRRQLITLSCSSYLRVRRTLAMQIGESHSYTVILSHGKIRGSGTFISR